MNPTTAHSSEVVGQLVLIETDPIRQRVKHAIAGFLAGYSGTAYDEQGSPLAGWFTAQPLFDAILTTQPDLTN